jgi:hypothetical protein
MPWAKNCPDNPAARREATTGELTRDLDGRLNLGREWRLKITEKSKNRTYVIRVIAEHSPFKAA